MSVLPKNVLYYGKEEPLPEQTALRAGPLSLIYEAGSLRRIRFGDREVLRMIYVAVRDRNWDTVPAVLSNVRIERETDSLRITYDAAHQQGDIDFVWRGTITGDAQGTLTFAMEGEARSTFLRNRIGFCVLHPIRECAGQPCVVEKVDGTVEEGTFPRLIAPHQPFMDMRAITHEVAPGIRAEVRFEGDVFEMEDHRNWTDASYKTYCTPLARPYPVEIAEGTRIVQSVRLRLIGKPPKRVKRASDALAFRLRGRSSARRLPQIGLGVASHGQGLTARESERLRALNLAHLRVDLHPASQDWRESLTVLSQIAYRIGAKLECALFLTDGAEVELLSHWARKSYWRDFLARLLIFPVTARSTSERWMRVAREVLWQRDMHVPLFGGTNAYFAELNRGRLPRDVVDGLCFSLNPQVHAFDNATLVENLAGQAETVYSARAFAGRRKIAVSPVTLKPRFNPNATGSEPESESAHHPPAHLPAPGELPEPVDVRQMSLFGACWTLGSLKYLAESGAHSVTYYETTGWRGVMETEQGSPLPEVFRSLPGAVFPMYHVFADVGEFAGGQILPAVSSDPLRIDGLALQKDGRTRILLANMRAELQEVVLPNMGDRVQARFLDETNAEEMMRAPEAYRARPGEVLPTSNGDLTLRLLPYAIARIDIIHR